MTTLFTFQPSVSVPYQFQPTLDGVQYSASVPWNLAGQRYYLQIQATDGTVVFYEALIGSEVGVNIQSLSWDEPTQTVTVTTIAPHGYAVGETIDLTIAGAVPAAYNGIFECFVTGAATVEYSMSTFPGVATALGALSYDIDMVAGYFNSVIVWRSQNNQFEVSP